MSGPSSPAFGLYAERYARYRPTYPPALYDLLLSHLEGSHSHAVDLGAGSGQVAVDLSKRFDRVTAVDPDAAMAALIPARDGLDVVVARAEEASFPDASIDLVTAGTAFHWMDENIVCPRAARWLRPGGVFAAFIYSRFTMPEAPGVEAIADAEGALWEAHKDERLAQFVPYVERMTASGAFARVEAFSITHDWRTTPEAFAGLGMTTSFGNAYAQATGDEAAYWADFSARIKAAAKSDTLLVRYPIDGAIGWA